MAARDGANRALALGVGVGVGVSLAIAVAWRFSEKRVHQAEMEHEAQTELVRFASGLARCAAGDQGLPETSERVPSRLGDVAGKPYTLVSGDYRGAAFTCAKFAARSPQRLQYRWVKDGSLHGRVEARGDADADGVPDSWYEIRIDCSNAGCEAPNYPFEVLSDGRRVPPGLLGLLGRARATEGQPPSLAEDDAPRGRAGSTSTAAPPAPVLDAGASQPLDTLLFEAERRAAAKLPGAHLLELQLASVRGAIADPKQGASMSALYGVSDAGGRLAKGAELLRVTFDSSGLSDALERAPRELRRAGFPECLPSKLLASLPASDGRTVRLTYDASRQRPLWWVQEESAARQSYAADSCAKVK